MNRFCASGRLVKDPQERRTAGGDSISTFTLAIDKQNGKNEADYIGFVSFGKLAEYINKHLKKGNRLYVESSVQNNNYDGKNGEKVFGHKFLVYRMEDFYDWKTAKSDEAADESYYPEDDGGSVPF